MFQTGPKGVIKDWQRYKQLEAEKRASQSLEKMQLAKKLTLTCRSVRGPNVLSLISGWWSLGYSVGFLNWWSLGYSAGFLNGILWSSAKFGFFAEVISCGAVPNTGLFDAADGGSQCEI